MAPRTYLFRKHLDSAKAGSLPVLFLVHGSSISSRPSFDLTENSPTLKERAKQLDYYRTHSLGMAHSVVLGVNRQYFWHVMRAFLTTPAVSPS